MKKVFFSVLVIVSVLFSQSTKSDVFLQGFYWNSPPGGIWYDSLAKLAPKLASAGFGAIWFPSPVKGAGGPLSMGYDPYDHYDFGEFYQKGSTETRFGSKNELIKSVQTFKNYGIEVYADAVLRHMIGGDKEQRYQCKPYPTYPDKGWMSFNPASKRFPKDSSLFIPNQEHCIEPWVPAAWRFGEWLDHDKKAVRDSLVAWGQYLKNVIGFSGFRLDAVKAITPGFIADWLKNTNQNAYAVAEYWDGIDQIKGWLNQVLGAGANISMFDFPLRYTLKEMCQNQSFDMRTLDGAGLVNSGVSGFNVSTFVENHDFDRMGWDGSIDGDHSPIISNKKLAYAYIIFSEGRPCVFFKDYVDYGLGGKIDTLIWIRKTFLAGGTTKRSGLNPWYIRQDGSQDQNAIAANLYIAKRNGNSNHPEAFLLINNNPNQWIDVWVDGQPNKVYRDYTGNDVDKTAASDGRVKLWCPPMSYTIYVADNTKSINFEPTLNDIPNFITYVNFNFKYQLSFADANDKNLTFTLSGNPTWLNITNSGLLYGKPGTSDVGTSTVTVTIKDPKNASVSKTFTIEVKGNKAPKFITTQNDTTVIATKRFEKTYLATDDDGDNLLYSIISAPNWLSIDNNGVLSGTPAIKDTVKNSLVHIKVTDNKGGYDSLKFNISVYYQKFDTIKTYSKPKIDGEINISDNDWKLEWQRAIDPDTDSYWKPTGGIKDNECLGIYVTWDSDSLYIGNDYLIKPTTSPYKNTSILYIDAGLNGGITDFNSNNGYKGAYPRNFRFRQKDAIDLFFASYYLDKPTAYRDSAGTMKDITPSVKTYRNKNGQGFEASIAWSDIYKLGKGKLQPGAKLKFVSVIAGGDNWGAGDACPNNSAVKGTSGPDSLINLVQVEPDKDNDGLPDPTSVIIVSNEKFADNSLPRDFGLEQNYPNPFNPTTVIKYQIPYDGYITLKVYDILGKEVVTLVNDYVTAGYYSYNFNASNLPSGVYFYSLNSGKLKITKKMILVK
ncbi:MAG TPA: putative Ig domain-containing protein [Ignavibacteriales bacterium]|nr:putative Ig domain-containing protein [Ignavibacteriales bacterium]HRR19338.1 putative Ig domain-containing protein [Ignavibacteriales bacterium]